MAPSRKAIGRGASHTGTSKLRSATPDAPVVANGVSPTRNRAGNDVVRILQRKLFPDPTNVALLRNCNLLPFPSPKRHRASQRDCIRCVTRGLAGP